MAFDPHREDYQRMGLRFARALDGESPAQAARSFAAFGRRFAQNRDGLPQTDDDRAFHLVAKATTLIDYELPFTDDEHAERLIAQGHAMLDEAFSYLYGRPQHDRPDSSEFLIRSPESRGWDMPVSAAGSRARTFSCEAGAVVVGNEAYGRYAGEVGIARQPLELDGRDTLAGWVCAEDRPLLPFVTCGRGFVLERPWGPASGWRD